MKRIIIDRDKCEACLSCSLACMLAHREDTHSLYEMNLTDPENETRNRVALDGLDRNTPLFCRHCNDPACVKACMSGAMTKDLMFGLTHYNADQCAGCFMCVMNCSYGILKPDNKTNEKVVKCDFCAHDEDGPNCVRNCPTNAIQVEEVPK